VFRGQTQEKKIFIVSHTWPKGFLKLK